MGETGLRLAISGLSGCGNTTVSHMLAKKLNLKCINYTFRNLAKDRGISLEDLSSLAEEDDSWDRDLDVYQVELAKKESCILASRLAIWMLKEADLKIYLKASEEVRFMRIAKRENLSLSLAKEITSLRDIKDRNRYQRLYNIDILNLSEADLVLETDQSTPHQLTEKIIDLLILKKLLNNKRR